jgi:endonuclease/exonuclease/phosphatase family metal-dependent hydrolase
VDEAARLTVSVISVCTYNIHGAVGSDGRLDPGRIAAVVQETGSDIVALQEVEHHAVAGEDLPNYLARSGGYQLYLGPTLIRYQQLYGNVLLSRLPASAVRRVDLSVFRREPRGALDVELQADSGTLRVINTHLGLRPGERRQQVQRLLQHLESVGGADITVLTGDINEWFLWGRPVRWLNRHFSPTPAPATFPAVRPLLALDRIWINPRRKLLSLQVHVSENSRRASDHLPVCARFSLT